MMAGATRQSRQDDDDDDDGDDDDGDDDDDDSHGPRFRLLALGDKAMVRSKRGNAGT